MMYVDVSFLQVVLKPFDSQVDCLVLNERGPDRAPGGKRA
jgi:hypothetical protein